MLGASASAPGPGQARRRHTHRDCRAAAVAYGDQIKRDRAFETEMLSAALREFRTQVQQREPELGVELGIMEFDGSVQHVN